MSLSVFSQWVANFLIAYVIPQQVQVMKVSGTFKFYAICLAMAFLLVYKLVPETKGLELEEMDALFGKPGAALVTPRTSATRHGLLHRKSAACSFGDLKKMPAVSTMPSMLVSLGRNDNFNDSLLQPTGTAFRRHVSEGDIIRSTERSRIHMARGGFVALY
mmetsp:Transcript_40224/g.110596  ORF Transcript_40224/g.110596 Transcript_40224/m.110596 type:complete len:161 (-) Transcript_40224:32-514(-)